MAPDTIAHTTTPTGIVVHAHQRRKILLTVCLALMAVIASVSGLNVAQPELAVLPCPLIP
jgi:hypothetical protein